MALIHSCEKSGNFLFRHRGEIPIVLFAFAIPVIYYTPAQQFSVLTREILTYAAILLSLLGFVIRAIAIATTPKGTSGRNTKSGQVAESLNTKGIYSMVRHPLYLGNYFMWIGIVLFTYSWVYLGLCSYCEPAFLAVLRADYVCRGTFSGKEIRRGVYAVG